MIKNKEDIENIIPYNLYKYIVETIRPYTEKYMSNRQKGICIEKKNYKYFETSYYIYKSEIYKLYDSKCIVIHEFPISNSSYSNKASLYDMFISKDLIKPVMIFINGKHIDWNDIELIIGNYVYLHFKNINEKINKLEIYELNFTIDYTKGKYNGDLPFVSFDINGNLTFENNNDNINYVLKDRKEFEKITIKKLFINKGFYKNIINDNTQRIFRSSFIFFDENGRLNDNYDAEDLIRVNNFNSLTVNKFSGIVLLIYNHNSNLDFKNNFSDHFANIEYWEDYLIENGLYDNLYDRLNLYFKTKSLIPENYYIDALSQILSFNYGLFKDIFNRYFNWITKYKFKIKDLKTGNYSLYIHSRHLYEFTAQIMLFINGKFISKTNGNYHRILNNIKFNIEKYNEEDEITIMYIRKSENRFMELELIEGKDIIIDPSFEVENSEMYTTCVDNQKFGIFNNRNVLYKIPFKYNKTIEGHYSIDPYDAKYYNSTIQLHSINQFRHYTFKAKEHLIKIILPKEFITCNNYYKYQIFINGLRLSQFDYKLIHPDINQPFTMVMLYLLHPVNKDDIVDVVYTPTENKEIFIKNIDSNIIEVDKNKLEFPIDPSLYNFYLNGELLNNDYIKYISNNKIIIDSSLIKSKFNLSIVWSIKNDNFMKEIFKSSDDLLSMITNNIPDDELFRLTNINKLNTDEISEDDYNKDNVSNKSIIFEIIKDHWVSNGLYKGIPTLYDYEKDEILDNIDIDGNMVIDLLDASKGGKIGC